MRIIHLFVLIGLSGTGLVFAQERPADALRRPEMIRRFDTNGDGKLDATEERAALAAMFQQRLQDPQLRGRLIQRFDKDGDGQLSDGEQQAALAAIERRQAGRRRPNARPGEIITKPALEERRPEQLKVGDVAPDFTLADVAGKRTFTLSEFRGRKPVVLVFGSITCSPFRREVEQVEKLYQQYKDRVEFVMVYIREAHPDSVLFVPKDNAEVLQPFPQTNTLADRAHHAEQCVATLHLTMPTVVDRPDNKVNAAYSGWPIRLVIVDREGQIADPGAPGPRGFRPEVVERWLKENVN